MKKLLLLVGAVLASNALACPVKKGFIANGLVKDTVKMEPLCELTPTMRGLVKGATWAEVWGTSNDRTGGLKVISVLNSLKTLGYREGSVQNTAKGKVWQLVKGNKVVVILTAVNDPLVFITIAGK